MCEGTRSRSSRTVLLFCFAAVMACLLRLAVVDNDMWLDEVWSLQLATQIESPVDVITTVHHDNNHYLNTLWLWCCGPDASTRQMRSLSLVAGAIAVVLTGALALPHGRLVAALAMLIAGGSNLFVQYSTEARGYAAALCCALLAHLFLREYLRRADLWRGIGFGTMCVLGTLSHLSFLQYYFAAVYWSAVRLSTDGSSLQVTCWRMIRCHLIAVLGIGALYLADVQHLGFGGGPRLAAFSVMQNAISVFAGGPLDHPARILVCLTVVTGICGGVRQLRLDGNDEWKFYACLFLLFPVLRVLLLPAAMMFERYFLIPLGFAAIPLALSGAQLLRGPTVLRAGCLLAGLLFLVGNAWHLAELRAYGRGQYQQTMAMVARESAAEIRISSDHPFRNQLLIRHYLERCAPDRRLEYVELDNWSDPPEWMICHHLPRDQDPPVNYFEADGQPRKTISVSGVPYVLKRHTRTAGLSGCEWLCYRRVTADAGRPATVVAKVPAPH